MKGIIKHKVFLEIDEAGKLHIFSKTIIEIGGITKDNMM